MSRHAAFNKLRFLRIEEDVPELNLQAQCNPPGSLATFCRIFFRPGYAGADIAEEPLAVEASPEEKPEAVFFEFDGGFGFTFCPEACTYRSPFRKLPKGVDAGPPVDAFGCFAEGRTC